MRQTSGNAKPRTNSANGGEQWTEAQKAAYQQAQAKAFRNFAKYFEGQPDSDVRIGFLAKVIEISDEPHETTNRFGTHITTLVKVELVDKPVAGIRFQAELTDNPDTIQNPKAAMNHLYKAATGKEVPEFGKFEWDTSDILHESVEGGHGRLVMAIIKRGGDRDDGQRGGLWSELRDFGPYIPAPTFEDEEDVTEAPSQPTQAHTAKKATRKAKAPAETTEDEKIPF
jgi:hypothetical protein